MSETSSGESNREVPIPRKRRRMEADLEYDSCHNNFKDRTLRKTKSMSEIPAKRISSTIPDLTVSTNTGLKVQAAVQEVEVEAIVEKDVEGNVFADSEDHSLAADIKPSDETDVTKIINEDSSVLASGDSEDGSDIPVEFSIETTSPQLLASCESDNSSENPAESTIVTSSQQMQSQLDQADDKTPCQPNIIDIRTPEHESEPNTVEVLTQDILNDTNNSF